jgi:hypothetical protein
LAAFGDRATLGPLTDGNQQEIALQIRAMRPSPTGSICSHVAEAIIDSHVLLVLLRPLPRNG